MPVTRKMHIAAMEAFNDALGSEHVATTMVDDGRFAIMTRSGDTVRLGPAILAAIEAAHRRFKCTPTPARSASTNTSSRATAKTKRARTSSTSTR